MDHSINLTHDGTLILRIPKGYEVDKVVVEEMGTENRKKFVHMPADISDYCDELWVKAYERGKTEGQPRKGKWIYNSPVTMKCDQCGLVIKDWDWHRFKYCPNCISDMRGEQE